jgi:hypothetical protein
MIAARDLRDLPPTSNIVATVVSKQIATAVIRGLTPRILKGNKTAAINTTLIKSPSKDLIPLRPPKTKNAA